MFGLGKDSAIRNSQQSTFGSVRIQNTELESAFLPANVPSAYKDHEAFLKFCAGLSHNLPNHLKEEIYNFKRSPNQDGVLLLKGLSTDPNLMPTPSSDNEVVNCKTSFHSEAWLATIGALLGEPYGFIQEGSGELFVNVRPTLKNSDNLSSESSKILLDFHTEVAFHPALPDYLLLYCLRPDHEAKAETIYSGIKKVLPRLDCEIIEVLRTQSFITGIDYSFGSESGTKGNGPRMSILSGSKNDPLLTFDPDLMIGVNERAEMAISRLKTELDRCKQSVILEAGDLLIVDNLKSVHGRTEFTARYDGFDRWLQRLVVKRDLRTVEKDLGIKERILTWVAN